MNYNYIKISTLFFFLLFSLCYAQNDNLVSEADPVKSFKTYITKHFESYKVDNRERLAKLGGGWAMQYYEPSEEYNIDVQTTNSLISPFIGICEFTLTRNYTGFHSSKEEAKKDGKFRKSDRRNHIHKYAFQEGKWVVTSRRSQKYDNSYDCNEAIKGGEQKGDTNHYGCWEKDN